MARLNRTIATATIALWAASAAAGETGQPETAPNPPALAPPATPPVPQNGATSVPPPAAPTPPQAAPALPQAAPALPQAAPAALPQPVPQQPAVSKGTPALVLDTEDYEGILGKSVRAVNGDDLGRIIDVILDKEGRTRAAIIDFGGFLGVGSRKIAVDWRVLKFTDGKSGALTLQLSRNQVRVSPEYKTGEPIVVLGATSPNGSSPEGEPAQAAASGTPDKPVQDKPTPPAQEKPPEKAPAEKPADKPAEAAPDR